MSINNTTNSDYIRTNLWSNTVKDVLQEELQLDRFINWVTDFPDGDTLNIPTFSELTLRNYAAGENIQTDNVSSGNFTLTIDKYYQTGFKIPDKFRQDSFYISQVESNYVGKLSRALMEQKESDVAHLQASQTSANPNTINGVDHRFVGTGSSGVIAVKDVHKAKLALDMASVSRVGRAAFIDPMVTYTLSQISALYDQTLYGANSTLREGTITGDMTPLVGSIAGIAFYESQFLDDITSETIVATAPNAGSVAASTGKANFIVGEEAFVGAMRTMPDMLSFYDNTTRSMVYHSTVRYGVKLYRPEALVTIITV